MAARRRRRAPATFAAPGTQGRRQSHAKREGRRWGNMNGAHWEDGAAARRTCSTWPFGCERGAPSCGSAWLPPRAPKPAPARRRTRRRRPPRAAGAPPCRRPRAAPRARAAAAAAPASGCAPTGRGWLAAPACAGASAARGRTPPPTSGAGAGGAARRAPRGMTPSAACARAPSSHRWRPAELGRNALSEMNDPAQSCSGTLNLQKRAKSVSRICLGPGGLRARTSCGRSARRRPPEWRAPRRPRRDPSPTPDARRPCRATVFTLVPVPTKNACKYSHTSLR